MKSLHSVLRIQGIKNMLYLPFAVGVGLLGEIILQKWQVRC